MWSSTKTSQFWILFWWDTIRRSEISKSWRFYTHMQYVRTVNRKVSKICLQMGLLNEDIAFHSSIPAPLDITVAVVYSVFGELNLVYNTINGFSLSSAQAEMNSSMKQGILQRSLASSLLFLTVLLCVMHSTSTYIYPHPLCTHPSAFTVCITDVIHGVFFI